MKLILKSKDANLAFYPISNTNHLNIDCEKKYFAGAYGEVYTSCIYTESEIKSKYPDVEKCSIEYIY